MRTLAQKRSSVAVHLSLVLIVLMAMAGGAAIVYFVGAVNGQPDAMSSAAISFALVFLFGGAGLILSGWHDRRKGVVICGVICVIGSLLFLFIIASVFGYL